MRLRSVWFSCSGWFWFRFILRLKLLRSDPNVVFGSSVLLGSFSLVCFTTTSFAVTCRPNHLHRKPGRGKLPVPVETWLASSSRDPLRSLLSSRTVMLTGRGLFLLFKVRRIGGSSSGRGNRLTEGGMSGFSPSIARSSARLVLHRWTTSGQPCLFGVEVGRRLLFELVAANIQSLWGLVELSWWSVAVVWCLLLSSGKTNMLSALLLPRSRSPCVGLRKTTTWGSVAFSTKTALQFISLMGMWQTSARSSSTHALSSPAKSKSSADACCTQLSWRKGGNRSVLIPSTSPFLHPPFPVLLR